MRETYREYCDLKDAGLHKDANKAAQDFVEQYLKTPDQDFLLEICEAVDHKLNHHIWSGIVLPFYRQDPANPVAVKCLIHTVQNLYSNKSAHETLNWISEQQLVAQYLDLVPDDAWAAERKKSLLADWLAYSIHEWPSGVLYGRDGATVGQCQEILDAVDELQKLDHESEFADLCIDVRSKTQVYRGRLRSTGFDSE